MFPSQQATQRNVLLDRCSRWLSHRGGLSLPFVGPRDWCWSAQCCWKCHSRGSEWHNAGLCCTCRGWCYLLLLLWLSPVICTIVVNFRSHICDGRTYINSSTYINIVTYLSNFIASMSAGSPFLQVCQWWPYCSHMRHWFLPLFPLPPFMAALNLLFFFSYQMWISAEEDACKNHDLILATSLCQE